ncbi:MAG: M28 family peptidase [Candidatus Korobacteraceae bacterium]
MTRRALHHIIFIAACLLISIGAKASDLKYGLASREVIMSRLKAAPRSDTGREDELAKMFREVGCQPAEQPVKGLHQPNVLCILAGSSDSVIVVGGHFDHADEGDGIIDDWSGASLLPSLYQSLANRPRSHTFVFIGFGGEEQGLVGSEFYAKHLTPEQRKQIVAMVNLECLGVTPTKVWTSHSEPQMVRMLLALAQSMQIPLSGVNVDNVGTTDSESFAHYKIPRITIHSITQETWPLLHSKNDNLKAIKEDLYYDSYRLITPYLVLLDQQLPTVLPMLPPYPKPQL